MTDDLIILRDEKRKRNKKGDGDNPIAKVPGFVLILDKIAGLYSPLPDPPRQIRLAEVAGIAMLCEETDGQIIRPLCDYEIGRILSEYINAIGVIPDFIASYDGYDTAKYRQLIDHLIRNLPVLRGVAPVRFLSDPGHCFHRLDFDLTDGGMDATALDGFLSRCSDPQAVGQWIGSLFVESPRECYLWLHGEGGDGKSTLVKFLARLLGDGYKSRVVPQPGDRFWTSGLLGASLVAFNDTNNYGFPASGLFKSLTGGDAIQIEEKGKPLKNATISAKFIFTSNEKPKLSSERADRRRAIYIEVAALPDEDRDFNIDTVLWNDRANIISQCVSLYDRMKTAGGHIKCDTTKLDELISDNEMEFEAVFEKWFVDEPGSHVAAVRFAEIVAQQYKQRHDATQFRAWLSRSGKSKSIKSRIGGVDKKIYVNIREKNFSEKVPQINE